MKKSYRIWLALLVVGTFFVFFGELALDRTLNSALLRTLLQDKIGTMLGLTFDYRAVRLSFIPLGIEFHEVKARTDDNREFSAARASADLSWWSLFMGAPKVGNFRITKPVVRITSNGSEGQARVPAKDSAWHWPQLVTSKLERLSLSEPDLHLDITSAQGQRHLLTVQGGDLQLDFRADDKVLIALHLDAINYRHNDKHRLQGMSITAEGEFSTEGFILKIDKLNAKHIEQLHGEVRGQTAVNAQRIMTSPLQVQGDFSLRGDLALLADLLNIERSRGYSEADFNLAMTFAPKTPVDFKARGRAKVKQALLGGIHVHDSEAHLTVTPQQLLFTDGKLVVAGEPRGTFSGSVGFVAPIDFDFNGTIARVTFAELMSTFNTKLELFNFDLATQRLRVHGRGRPFALQVQSKAQLSAWQVHTWRNQRSPPVCAVDFDLRSNRKHLRFKHLHGDCTAEQHSSGTIAMQGTIAYGTGQLDLRIDAPALNLAALDFLSPQQLQGQGKLTTTISGAGAKVLVSTKLNLKQVQMQKTKITRAEAQLDFYRNFVVWQALRLNSSRGGVVSSASGKLTYADLSFDAQLSAQAVQAADLQPWLRRAEAPLTFGIEQLTAQLSGVLPYPLAYRGQLQAQLQTLQATDGEHIAERLNFSAVSKKRGWQVQLKGLQREALLVRGSITHRRRASVSQPQLKTSPYRWERLGLSRRDLLQVQLSAAQTDTQAQQLPYLGAKFKARIDAFNLKLSGAVPRLQGAVQTKLSAIVLAGLHLATLQLKGEVDAGKVTAQVSDAADSVQGQVQVDLATPQLPFKWQFSFKEFDVRQLWWQRGDASNYARLRGSWDMQGKLLQWFNASGALVLEALRVRHRPSLTRERAFLLQLQEPQRLALKHGKLSVVGNKRIVFASGDTLLAVKLQPDCTLRRPTLDLDGTVDTALLPYFFDEIDVATGFLELEGKLRWQGDEPQLGLEVARLSPLAVSVAGLRPAFNDVDIRARYRRGTLVIEKLQARKGEGTIVVQGEIQRDRAAQSFLQLALSNAHFIHPVLGFKNTELHLDGNLTLRWHALPLTLAGELTVSRASNFSDFDIRKVILASFGEKKYRPSSLVRKAMVNFDLSIVADRSLTIDNRNVQTLLSARLQLRGDNLTPRLGGFVKIEKGRFVYRRRFNLTRGVISFDGGRRINPRLDLRATSEVSSYVVNLHITGTAAEPVGKLTVEPSLREDGRAISEADILILLSRGALPDPDKALTNTGSTGFSEVTNVLVGQFEQPLEDLLKHSGQDVISRIFIETYATPEGTLYPKLTAPVNLPWRDWGLRLQVDPYVLKLLTEYPVHDNITLSGSISTGSRDAEEKLETRDSTNDQAVDLKFNFSIP